ncbi:putative secreted protein [Collimonas fungivorans]|uniref:Putative secreted protein n=1 Tax=Collimonas fungivorans TaxID=158899 RepID=A0A127PEX8_9BURK|nr:hypothetical protein [Collimonas fungivorans]AMO96372.1 putative secreted protein [Collimonas fungivorans]
MHSFTKKSTYFFAAALAAAIATSPVTAAAAEPAVLNNTAFSPAAAVNATVVVETPALHTWHEKMKKIGPPAEGCFHASYPSANWEKVACGPRPTYRSSRPIAPSILSSSAARSLNKDEVTPQIVGNGTDYAAQAAGVIRSATGSFPAVSGVKSEKGINVLFGGSMSNGTIGANQYTLQLNTDINASSTACAKLGYGSCHVWEQFIYSTDAYTDGTHPMAFIQSWVFPSQADYDSAGCPAFAGWDDATDSNGPACVHNSNGISTAQFSIAQLANMKLSGSASSTGNDVVTLTVGKDVYADKVSDSTVFAALWWKQAEFTLVGNGGGSQASFNKGSSVGVKLAIDDGGTHAPTCLGPDGHGSTGETNNLTLGKCTVGAGTAANGTIAATNPYIQFTAAN